MKISHTLIQLIIVGGSHGLSFVANFTNLQELTLSFANFFNVDNFGDFEKLQGVTFTQLRILKFEGLCPNHGCLTKFLENNGRNLEELHIRTESHSLNLAIVKLCPNLKSLATIFGDDEVETLKVILNGCQELESLGVITI